MKVRWYAWVSVVLLIGLVCGCVPIAHNIFGAIVHKKQPAPIQVNYRGCRSSDQCTANMELVREMKGDCNSFPNYDCSQYDPIIAHLDKQRNRILAIERSEEERLQKLQDAAKLRHEESLRQEKERHELHEREKEELAQRREQTRQRLEECQDKRDIAKRTCNAWINTNCKPILVSRTGCQQFTQRTWGRVTTWTECVDTYKAQCTKAETMPLHCKPEAANGEVFSNAYIDQCEITSTDVRVVGGRSTDYE